MQLFAKSLFHFLWLGITLLNIHNLFSQENQAIIRNFDIVPNHIEIGSFFEGKQVSISADIPECDGVVIELEGKIKDLVLNKKGEKKFIWLNVAQITVKNAPSVYFLASSDKLENICAGEELEKELLGYSSLKHKIIFKSDSLSTGDMVFDEFIKLKEHNGSYNINNKINFDSKFKGRQKVSTILNIPPFIPAGNYEILLYCFRSGNLFKKTSANFLIKEVGLTAFIKNLAFGNPALYGIFAILIALAAGIIIGIIFNKRRSGGQ